MFDWLRRLWYVLRSYVRRGGDSGTSTAVDISTARVRGFESHPWHHYYEHGKDSRNNAFLSPLGCTQHRNSGQHTFLFQASFVGKSLVYGLFKTSFFLMKIMYMRHSETCSLQHSVWTGSCVS